MGNSLMKQAHLYTRFFVDTTEVGAAESAANSVIDILLPHCHVVRKEVKPYWKIPENYEVFLVLNPKDELHLSFHNIMANLAEVWEAHYETDDDGWAIWTKDLQGKFLVPGVVWAILGKVPEGAAVTDDLPSSEEQSPA
jgi:hypothetical protein